ncbi:phosphopantothenoylcysteine decarboxylase [Microbacterium aurum]|jgi:phosphopantothenoylcysteine decarboxylase/phosphopantothenate--cysteine ligase|uniref:Coenzyme A biosynthesis bifunctional protein CoaBC n=1 Tax=Microbacterium aurum TaxID=36805 RepID=A0A1P8U5Y1_9MICO|nr:bifunctional phosphopantothenoylcysteine decarboxylase/phosphopantothenate--cysteine ligase CoaBC [Microbacterium aurum]APZ33493.1 phosphopantothenoylcysteine decarboxylase [Microbacterium aurum]MBM7827173.1 phosphopantothenoylcysteine decarboxylase/phosphopantothenate--cysteine ligase [Microbacterium aurum]MBZ6371662.1 bifunctional phosphopantothenoylcysteine decarboxylase/phosphopantothenate--cysteine ligase CoaBC [Microbacterium hominis]
MFVVVGVTGGIAAYKTVQVVRTLVTSGHEVHVVPTADALRFVGTATWEAVSRNSVTTSVHEDVAQVRHVALGTSADLVIVAPATANTLARMAAGIADDLLGVTLLATTAPVVVAPAMHTAMWEHAATQQNIQTLRGRGVHVVGPADGPLTGGDSGPGRMVEPDEIVAAALAVAAGTAAHDDLAGRRVAVSTGGTREPIDPVRFLGNRSSGRQGAELALAAADRGADVTLVAAHVDDGVLDAATRHPHITLVHASTAADLEAAMTDAAARADIVAMVAAVADYRAAEVAAHKLRKEDGPLQLDLVENPDILAGLVAARRPGQTIVGFAAETASDDAELLERGRRKRARKGVDLLAVNRVSWDEGFEAAENRVLLLDARGEVVADAAGTKRAVADAVWDAVAAAR